MPNKINSIIHKVEIAQTPNFNDNQNSGFQIAINQMKTLAQRYPFMMPKRLLEDMRTHLQNRADDDRTTKSKDITDGYEFAVMILSDVVNQETTN